MDGENRPDYGLLDRAGFAQVAFYPRPDHRPPPPGASDIAFEVAPGVQLAARMYAAGAHLPTILYFHGNGEVASDHDDVAPLYRQSGLNLLVVEFRGYGESTGQPTFATLVDDANMVAGLAVDYLSGRAFNGPRFLMGRSMGAHSVLEIAANAADGFRGLILESGAGNARRWFERLPVDPDAAAQLVSAHEAKIRSIRLPTLLIHGAVDELIPLELALEMQQMLAPVDPELLIIPGAGHNDILWVGHREYFAAISRFVATHSG
ncbi:MAG TPA: alpha/beta hydrolase [Tepidiformaceae bacterium]|nr:alpha/beta hydrolase [Tepidiformaceae bacterium]